jgi:hypothetical protein
MASNEVDLGLVYGIQLDLDLDGIGDDRYNFFEYLEEKFYNYEFIDGKLNITNLCGNFEYITQSDYESYYALAIGIKAPDLPSTDPWNAESFSLEKYNKIAEDIKIFTKSMKERQEQILKDLNKLVKEIYDEYLTPELELEYEGDASNLQMIRTTRVRED